MNPNPLSVHLYRSKTMRIALCQINPIIGDLRHNKQKILAWAHKAEKAGARIALFPELSLCGYSPQDLLNRPDFLRATAQCLESLQTELPANLLTLVGCVVPSRKQKGRALHNAAVLFEGGKQVAVVSKRLLPTYDVFEEDRYFEPGDFHPPISVDGVPVGITVCEDIWADATSMGGPRHAFDPVSELAKAGAQLILNLSASPFTLIKSKFRPIHLGMVAKKNHVSIAYVNQVGGFDDLIFDGGSMVLDAQAHVLAHTKHFEEDLLLVEWPTEPPLSTKTKPNDEATLLHALELGTHDYVHKAGFKSAIVGLSGGVDSALTACLAVRALGSEHVLGVAMPTRYSSSHSLEDAQELARNLKIRLETISIDALFQSYLDALEPPLRALPTSSTTDLTWENIQSRIRCTTLMALSNRSGALVLTTGNKSEIGVGYSTLYGDSGGALSVLGDVYKTQVYALAHEINRQAGFAFIPERTLTKAPSAELRPNQTDQDTLPPYEELDAILRLHVEEYLDAEAIIQKDHERSTVERVLSMVRISEYKRRQLPPVLIVSPKAFGPGRHYPITHRYIPNCS